MERVFGTGISSGGHARPWTLNIPFHLRRRMNVWRNNKWIRSRSDSNSQRFKDRVRLNVYCTNLNAQIWKKFHVLVVFFSLSKNKQPGLTNRWHFHGWFSRFCFIFQGGGIYLVLIHRVRWHLTSKLGFAISQHSGVPELNTAHGA